MPIPFKPSSCRPGGNIQTAAQYLGVDKSSRSEPLQADGKPHVMALTFSDNQMLLYPITLEVSGDGRSAIASAQLDCIHSLSIPLA